MVTRSDMPLELIKEVNGVPEVDLLNKLHKVDIRSLQPGSDYDKKYIQGKLFKKKKKKRNYKALDNPRGGFQETTRDLAPKLVSQQNSRRNSLDGYDPGEFK